VEVPTGFEEKLLRADELISLLDEETSAIFGSRDYLRPFIGGARGIGYGFEVIAQPPWQRWSVIVGEVVHDLRSALDQLAWAASLEWSGPAPEPLTGRWRQVSFPVCLVREDLFAHDGSLNIAKSG